MERKREFFKGILGFVEKDEELLAKKASESIYRWCWEFMRIHPVFWYARTRGIDPVDPVVFEMYRLVGDLSHDFFHTWWNETGRRIFSETRNVPKVTAINLFALDAHPFKEKDVLYLDIPLDISRRTIMKQIRLQLDKVHESRSLNVTKHSSAQLKLYTKKYRLQTIEKEYWVLLYRMLHSKIRMWQIGDRLQLSPSLKVRGLFREEGADKLINQLNSLTGRHFYKAKNTLDNLMFKEFPNYKIKDLPDDYMPFGAAHHADYLKSTKLEADRRQDIKKRKTVQEKLEERNAIHSEFHQWLVDNFAGVIKLEVIKRNRIENQYKLPGSRLWQKLPNFITGYDNQL